MSGRQLRWILRAVQVAWFRRARSRLPAWVLACAFVLCTATPARAVAAHLKPREFGQRRR